MKITYDKYVVSTLVSFDLLWTYFGVLLEYIWSASECVWMTSDDIGVSPTNGSYTPCRSVSSAGVS